MVTTQLRFLFYRLIEFEEDEAYVSSDDGLMWHLNEDHYKIVCSVHAIAFEHVAIITRTKKI